MTTIISVSPTVPSSEAFAKGILQDIIDGVTEEKSPPPMSVGSSDEAMFFQPIVEVNVLMDRLAPYLADAAQMNSTIAVPPELTAEITQRVDEILQSADSSDLLELWDLLLQHHYYDTKGFIGKILAKLKSEYSGIEAYIKGDRDPIMTPRAVQIILDCYHSNYKWEKDMISCHVIKCIPSLMDEMAMLPNDSYRGWIIQTSASDHLTPVFVHKKEGKIQVLITDSRGITGQKKVLEVFQYLFHDREDIEIWTYKLNRQIDGISCPVFSILDLVNIFRSDPHMRDIFEFFRRYIPEADWADQSRPRAKLRVFGIDLLPPEMMKVTQSRRKLEQYTRSSPSFTKGPIPVFSRTSPDRIEFQTVETLERTVDKKTCYNPSGYPLNKYVEKKHFRFLHIVLRALLEA